MSVVIACIANSISGYGLHATQVVSHFARKGREVVVRPINVDEVFDATVSVVLSERFRFQAQPQPWEFVLHPPHRHRTPNRRTAIFTMWETTRLPEHSVHRLNEAEHIIVPCRWNRDGFKASGVHRPIHIVPLGFDHEIIKPSPVRMDGPCVFGAAGRLAHGSTRKGVNRVIELFQRAFPNDQDVRLRVKGFPDCDISSVTDPRIEVQRKWMTGLELSYWLKSLTCFVSAARGEGWGLLQNEAMATGRPVIASIYGGLAEFMTVDNSMPVGFKIVKADEKYEGHGEWCMPDGDSMIEAMRTIKADRNKAAEIGRKAAESVAHLTWENSCETLWQTLQRVGVVS